MIIDATIVSQTKYTTGPVHNRNTAGTGPGIHGKSRISEKNNGSAVSLESRSDHAAIQNATIIAGAIQSGGRNPKREEVSTVPTASEPREIHAAKQAVAAAMSELNSTRRINRARCRGKVAERGHATIRLSTFFRIKC
jgi:hypothetical protein